MQTRVRTLSKLLALAGVVVLAAAFSQPAMPSTSASAAAPLRATPSSTRAPAPTPTRATAQSPVTATPTPDLLLAMVSDVLRVRSGPGAGYPILGQLQRDTPLVLLGRTSAGDWFQIAYPSGPGQRGWVSIEFLQVQGSPDRAPVVQGPPLPGLSATPPSAAAGGALGVVSESLRVRSGPGTGYPILGGLQPGAQVTLLLRSVDARWFQIVYPPGSDKIGWVSAEYVQLQDATGRAALAQAPPTPGAAVTTPTSAPATTASGGALVGVVNDALRVRGGPSTDYPILGRLESGTRLALLARSADGGWFQIAYPAGSDQRGWVSGEFLQVQGSLDTLASAPSPALTSQTAGACAPIPDQKYGTLSIASAPTDRPAASHADLNLALRGYTPANAPKALVDLSGSADPGAPNLLGLFGDKRTPAVSGTYQVYGWDWGANARGAKIDTPPVTLLGVQTKAGEVINTPPAGGDLGEGYVALVLYASSDRITLKYTREDNVVDGYTLHLENVCVEPKLLALYQEMNKAQRGALPALRPGQPLGRAAGAEIDVAVRDKGTFMDPRSRKDWW